MSLPLRRMLSAFIIALVTAATGSLVAQRPAGLTADQVAQRWRAEKELQSIAVVERKVMMPMRDGVRLATDVYRPKDAAGEGADDLRPHALQLQLLGRAERRPAAT